ncbi:Hypothetical protein PP7435_CHR3-0165 [Komagataella phaffii CBS 7435]|uniref:Uncharacterized protein n=2 Tax=Komagataella phaffii TaxID=460519 RepID=C4R680_KOMPG|nr:Hypothetical protein PAS_chr3_1005 [Komagataella phaffii GS115]AOA64042.1 GQ67_04135T0 [Komagataella phaffii]CAH2449095.1 Hypothetical protein BQ9382_C3-0940 [Komagataella phaffii CBS 7435]AOA69260.1 GQ68_04108T0 [Komagataella phaffii GS115]CAY71066.1 Hypothetical protein PAS_chr3_1005 [Komagataella phaffii GS115]SCV12165.1 Hypothetical protein PP7435_CHR3-0165 [Komagataella phaffii CBS 7435]
MKYYTLNRRFRQTKVMLAIILALSLFFYLRSINREDANEQVDIFSSDVEDVVPEPPKNKHHHWFNSKCPEYLEYSEERHEPFSEGPLKLPYMRPPEDCRTFKSVAVEKTLEALEPRFKDPDLFRLLENCLPNTLDTTILWTDFEDDNDLRSFIVTGDIHAEWLRDAARQLSVYQPFVKHDRQLQLLMKGAINQQALFISTQPYCNAFQPPKKSKVQRKPSAVDFVSPRPNYYVAFECKWELDSLASFLTLSNEYYENTGDSSFVNEVWLRAFEVILIVLQKQSSPTFNPDTGTLLPFYYKFQRDTRIGSETLPLAGTGNPINGGTGLVRSAFRPSDDSTIFQFLIPANAHMAVELSKISYLLKSKQGSTAQITVFVDAAHQFSESMKIGIKNNAIFDHPRHGKIYAYEIDGYGSALFMDDANIPSLLSLPELGFLEIDDPIYNNTRQMILSKSNPYFLKSQFFEGVGGPHIGLQNAWPMSLLMAIRTTDDDQIITKYLELVKSTTAGLGLMHESINIYTPKGALYTRPWFSWCNSEFGKTILDLASRKPHLIFKDDYVESFNIDSLFLQ